MEESEDALVGTDHSQILSSRIHRRDGDFLVHPCCYHRVHLKCAVLDLEDFLPGVD